MASTLFWSFLRQVLNAFGLPTPGETAGGEASVSCKLAKDAKFIVFFLGGPGAGKGTQCAKLATKYGYIQHLSIGDVLRAERNKANSEFAQIIARNMEQGTVGPMEITVELLRRAIDTILENDHNAKIFLIDGFPRKMDQMDLFEEKIARAELAIFLDCPENVRLTRLLERGRHGGQNRQDDDMMTIQKRFNTFGTVAMKAIKHLASEGRLCSVDADSSIEDVFSRVEIIMKESSMLEQV